MSPRTTYLITGADRGHTHWSSCSIVNPSRANIVLFLGLGPALLATYLTRPNTTVNHPQYAPQYGNLERQLTKQDRRKVQNRNAQRNYRQSLSLSNGANN